MPISHDLKTIFIHIPKSAGESIEKALGMYGKEESLWGVRGGKVLQHLTPKQLLRFRIIDPDVWDAYFSFAVVRNPWDKAVSEYHWYCRWHPPIPFDAWVLGLSFRMNQPVAKIVEVGHDIEQHEFTHLDGKQIVDHVARFEDIDAEWAHIQDKLGLPQSQLLNDGATASVGRGEYEGYYTDLTKDVIAEIYAKDVELFGYAF
jgi:chondroitin 4-sulfotransferase 11